MIGGSGDEGEEASEPDDPEASLEKKKAKRRRRRLAFVLSIPIFTIIGLIFKVKSMIWRDLEKTETFKVVGFKELDEDLRYVSEKLSRHAWGQICFKDKVGDPYVDDASYQDIETFVDLLENKISTEWRDPVEIFPISEATLRKLIAENPSKYAFSGEAAVWVRSEDGGLPRFIYLGGPHRHKDDRLMRDHRPSEWGKKFPIYVILELKVLKS